MKKIVTTTFIFALLATTNFLYAQSLPKPDHIVLVIYENHAYQTIMSDSVADAPYINSFKTDTNAAIFTKSYAIRQGSQPNYLALYSGNQQGMTGDSITPVQFTDCNIGASLLQDSMTFIGYAESMPSVGYLGDTYGLYARKHNPWSNWQGSATNGIPASSNVPFSNFPSNYSSLPDLSFVVPNEYDNMHSASIADGDTWLKDNMNGYIQWAKENNSLLILTFDEDDDSAHYENIPTIFIGQMVKGGNYSNRINHYTVCKTIEDIYGITDCSNSDTAHDITAIWRSASAGINQLTVNNNQLSIYPNPANNQASIISNQLISDVQVKNVLGQTLLRYTPVSVNPGTPINLNVSKLAVGMYFVTVTEGDKTETQKIIVNR